MTRWVRHTAVLSRRTLDGMLVRAPDGEMALLSPPAAALLEVLAEPHTREEAADVLARETGAAPDVVGEDVRALLDDFTHRGLVTPR